MAIILIVVVVVGIAISAPIVAAGLVAVASRREDSKWSLAEPPSGPVSAGARRIVAFRVQGIAWPRPLSRVPVRHAEPVGGHARAPRPAQTHRPVPTSR